MIKTNPHPTCPKNQLNRHRTTPHLRAAPARRFGSAPRTAADARRAEDLGAAAASAAELLGLAWRCRRGGARWVHPLVDPVPSSTSRESNDVFGDWPSGSCGWCQVPGFHGSLLLESPVKINRSSPGTEMRTQLGKINEIT